MAINIKTTAEIEKMRIAGKLAADGLTMIEPYVVAGVSTDELDQRCHNYIVNQQQAIPAPLNYKGFPKSICTSVNHQVCHGIPNQKKLKKAILSILISPLSKMNIMVIRVKCFMLVHQAHKQSALVMLPKKPCTLVFHR